MEIIIEGKKFEVVNAENFKGLDEQQVQATAKRMVESARKTSSCKFAEIKQIRTDGKNVNIAMGKNTLFSRKL